MSSNNGLDPLVDEVRDDNMAPSHSISRYESVAQRLDVETALGVQPSGAPPPDEEHGRLASHHGSAFDRWLQGSSWSPEVPQTRPGLHHTLLRCSFVVPIRRSEAGRLVIWHHPEYHGRHSGHPVPRDTAVCRGGRVGVSSRRRDEFRLTGAVLSQLKWVWLLWYKVPRLPSYVRLGPFN